jgi:branched-chain amino acid aminotransferase
MPLVWLDGALVPREEARVSIDDLGFLYGAACFETMRSVNGTVFRLDRHFDRLESGFTALGMQPPPRADLARAIEETLTANGLKAARIRLTVSAGRGAGRPDLSSATAPTVLVVAEPTPPEPAPAHLVIASFRIDAGRPLAFAKHANYLASLLALSEARAAGCDDALLLNGSERVAEAATANVFAVLDGVLVTPPLSEGPLPGVTREAILECARSLRLREDERPIDLNALAAADEGFLTNSIIGVRPVASVDGLWDGAQVPGPVTAMLAERYAGLVRAECGVEG